MARYWSPVHAKSLSSEAFYGFPKHMLSYLAFAELPHDSNYANVGHWGASQPLTHACSCRAVRRSKRITDLMCSMCKCISAQCYVAIYMRWCLVWINVLWTCYCTLLCKHTVSTVSKLCWQGGADTFISCNAESWCCSAHGGWGNSWISEMATAWPPVWTTSKVSTM